MAFTVTNTWASGNSITDINLDQNFTDIENVINEVDTNNSLWDATRILVGSTTVSGGAVASIAVTGISVDLDNYELFVLVNISRDTTTASFTLSTDGGTYDTQYIDGDSTTVSAGRTTDLRISEARGATAFQITSRVHMHLSENGFPFYHFHTGIAQDAVSLVEMTRIAVAQRNSALTDNIVTDVTITGSTGTPIQNGSTLAVYKIRKGF